MKAEMPCSQFAKILDSDDCMFPTCNEIPP